MRYRKLAFMLAFVPVMGMAQKSSVAQGPLRETLSEQRAGDEGFNSATRAVLLANCPKDMSQADWLRLMENPVNRSLYPLRITQRMLDSLDVSKLDMKFQYVRSSDR